MPWQAKDARRFTRKAKTPKQKRQWEHIADRLLAAGATEQEAITQASGVIKREAARKKK